MTYATNTSANVSYDTNGVISDNKYGRKSNRIYHKVIEVTRYSRIGIVKFLTKFKISFLDSIEIYFQTKLLNRSSELELNPRYYDRYKQWDQFMSSSLLCSIIVNILVKK